MTPRQELVIQWLNELDKQPPPRAGLSKRGAELAWSQVRQTVNRSDLEQAWRSETSTPGSLAIIVASTVAGAPLEWLAVALGFGHRVHLKHSSSNKGWCVWFAKTAQRLHLPVTTSPSRDHLNNYDLIVAMGTDDTVQTLQKEHPNCLGFGSKFSVALLYAPCSSAHLQDLAVSAAVYDGRGCMSPIAVFTDNEALAPRLAEHMHNTATTIPIGEMDDHEHATWRARRSLALVIGSVQNEHVISLPLHAFKAISTPRRLTVYVGEPNEIESLLHTYQASLSAIASVNSDLTLNKVRLTSPAQMQRPPLLRVHDGVAWIRCIATLQSLSSSSSVVSTTTNRT